MANSCMRILSPIAIPSAPPLPPSPLTMTMTGVSSSIMSRRFTAIASATPRSSDSMPGYGPGVAEIAVDLLLGVPSFDVTDKKHRLAVIVGEAGHDGVIVGKPAVAVNL